MFFSIEAAISPSQRPLSFNCGLIHPLSLLQPLSSPYTTLLSSLQHRSLCKIDRGIVNSIILSLMLSYWHRNFHLSCGTTRTNNVANKQLSKPTSLRHSTAQTHIVPRVLMRFSTFFSEKASFTSLVMRDKTRWKLCIMLLARDKWFVHILQRSEFPYIYNFILFFIIRENIICSWRMLLLPRCVDRCVSLSRNLLQGVGLREMIDGCCCFWHS